ncbi:MAG: ribosomal-processing cysteine protease Prp [Candidatus Ureaplasma intestinipullorum]|uniref:Ribosomal processing cysteine protease Prp n=1 Tax=Candidatus Ureaplasma intestinipullorum TaxID=2838770 RepID=A0A9E2KV92_9BACT|nr:ribosomal-processing cysteine protease Prp [Candidatus Ureaplasma intestinipullorum]
MININFYKNGLEVSGHSEYDVEGKDIVCAGVSAIVMGSLNWFKNNDKITVKKGYIKIVIANGNDNELKYLSLLNDQLQAMYHGDYKKYMSISNFNHDINKKG